MSAPEDHSPASPFQAFWMGGFEGADHINGLGFPLDMARANGHIEHLDEDYRRAAAAGLGAVRESIGWRLAEPESGVFALERVVRMAQAAARHKLQVLWTLMHYGTPADVDLFDDAMIPRFARFAAEVARVLKPLSPAPPVYTLINEISFVAWAVSATRLIHPYGGTALDESSTVSGYAVKRRLVAAVLAGMAAVRRVDPRARFLPVEPVVHCVAPPGRPDLAPLAAEVCGFQWQAWDMLAGRLEPELGGHPAALDRIGVNFYHCGQWEVETEQRLHWHERDPRRRPLSGLLGDVWSRYRRPLIIAETSHIGVGRAEWLNDVAAEVGRARAGGIPVEGLCLYPLIDRPDWNDPQHWHHSGLWNVAQVPHDANPAPEQPFRRVLISSYAGTLARWQRHLPELPPKGFAMPHLIVFSHLRWGFVYQRPQHLLSRLAEHYRVLFVEEPLHSPGPPRFDVVPQGPNIDVLCPRTPVEAHGFHDDQLSVLKPLLTDYLRDHGIDDYVVWFYTPMPLPLIAQLRPRAVVYDCMDELSAFKDAPRQLRQRETALLKLAGIVFTGGLSLYDAKRKLHDNVHCLPSAVDAQHFSPETLDPGCDEALEAERLQGHLRRPRLGFFGVIDERLDTQLLATLARARPDWQFIMAGPVVKIEPALLPHAPNIHWLGMQPYGRLPHLVAGWDVCLMPFALNAATRFISPTKTLEYMAAEKPIVSTAVPDVQTLYGDLVHIAGDVGAFLHACEQSLAETEAGRDQRIRQMLGRVWHSSWDRAAETVHELLGETLQKAATSPTAIREMAGMAGAPLPAVGSAEAPFIAHGSGRPPRHVRHLVIGAGPTGLSAAYHLGQQPGGSDTLLVEREDRVGGWCRSVEQDGFTFDYAGHIMFSNDPYVLELYDLLFGDNLHWQNREAWIYSKNVYTRYPFQGSLYGLPPKVLKECLIGAIEARFGPLKGDQPVTQEAPANFEEFIYKVWGKGIAEHFAIPYNEKLWAVPLDEMETSWLGGRVPLPDLEQMIDGALEPTPPPMGPNARFGYPLKGGFQALMNAFLPHLKCDLALNTSVLHVSPSRRLARLDDGRILGFDSLISTMPLPQLVAACGDEAPEEIVAAAQALRHVSVRCVNLGIGRENLTEKHWIYYPEDTVFHRIFVQGNASPHCNAPGGFGLTCEITYGPSKPLPCNGQALIERCIEDCRKVGIIRPDDPVIVANQVDLPCAYVVYDHSRAANVDLIRRWFAGFGITLAGRYSEWEYYNSDHAFIAGRKAADEAMASAAGQRVASAG